MSALDVRTEVVRFYSEGVKLAADLYLPADCPDPCPAVLLCHGYTGLKRLYMPDVGRYLARNGIAALAFDYKGWGESEGPPLRLAPYGRVADASAALAFLGSRPEIHPDRLGAFGWSYGTGTAIWLAAHNSQVKAVMGVVGVANGGRWLQTVRTEDEWDELLTRTAVDRRQRAATGRSNPIERSYVLHMDPASVARSAEQRKSAGVATDSIPTEFIDDTLSFNPEWVVSQIAPRPLTLIACDRDRVVPPDESVRLYDAAKEPKRFVVLSGYDHYDIYSGPAFEATMKEALALFGAALAE